jgi:hypothetical protein
LPTSKAQNGGAAAFQRVGLAVKEPTQRGFGRAVIGRSLQYSPHGAQI